MCATRWKCSARASRNWHNFGGAASPLNCSSGTHAKYPAQRKRCFGELSDDIRRAAEISAERALAPETIREACRQGLSQVFANASEQE
jgi:hypothetical protein